MPDGVDAKVADRSLASQSVCFASFLFLLLNSTDSMYFHPCCVRQFPVNDDDIDDHDDHDNDDNGDRRCLHIDGM